MFKVTVECLSGEDEEEALAAAAAALPDAGPLGASPLDNLPAHTLWVTADTNFRELRSDAVRSFVHCNVDSVRATLLNGRLCEWPSDGNVLAHLSACPSDALRRVVLHLRRAGLWEQNDRRLMRKTPTGGWLACVSQVEEEKEGDEPTRQPLQAKADEQRECCTQDPQVEPQADGDGVEAAMGLEEAIHKRLRGIYATYCLQSGSREEGGISLQAFQRFAADCKSALPRERVALLHVRERGRGYDGFLNMLLALAIAQFPDHEHAAALENLLERHVAPFADRWGASAEKAFPAIALFEALEATPPVRALLADVRPTLRHLFRAYCLCNPAAAAAQELHPLHRPRSAGGLRGDEEFHSNCSTSGRGSRRSADNKQDGSSNGKFLTLTQFMLFVHDFELFSIGANVDSRACARIFITGCGFEDQQQMDLAPAHASRASFHVFVGMIYRLAVLLSLPAPRAAPPQRQLAAQQELYECALIVLRRFPTLPLKALMQHMQANVFGRSIKLEAICRKVENRHWRKGRITPLGLPTDIFAAAASLTRKFNPMWRKDGCPGDYFDVVRDQVDEQSRARAFEANVQLNGAPTGNQADGDGDLIDVERTEEGAPSAPELLSYTACRDADELFGKCGMELRGLAELLVRQINGAAAQPSSHNLDSVSQAYQAANLRYTSVLRGCQGAAERSRMLWRWGVTLSALISRVLAGCLPLLQERAGSSASCWLTGSMAARGDQGDTPKLCAELLRVCEFARACLDQSEEKFRGIAHHLTQMAQSEGSGGSGSGSAEEYKLAIDRAAAFRMMAQVKVVVVRLRIFGLSLGAGPPDVASLRGLLRQVAKGAMEADHFFGRAAVFYEKVRFSRFFRVPLLNNWSFVLFERALSKATASVALERAAELPGGDPEPIMIGTPSSAAATTVEATEEAPGPNASRPPLRRHFAARGLDMRPKIAGLLQRAREIAGLGYELEGEMPSGREWHVPVALLWTWGNCLEADKVVWHNIETVLFEANKVSRHRKPQPGALQFTESESDDLLSEGAKTAVRSLFSRFDKTNKGYVVRKDLKLLLKSLFSWDTNGFYTQLVPSQMRTLGLVRLSLERFTSLMLFLALKDPMGFSKCLYVCDALGPFGFEDMGHGANKSPSDVFMASLLYQSFEESSPRTRLRRLHRLRRVNMPSPILFRGDSLDDVRAAADEAAVNEKTVMVETEAATPESRLVDYFVLLDAHQVDPGLTASEVEQLAAVEDLPLKPCVRSVWPPKVEDLLASKSGAQFSVEELAAMRHLHQEVPLPEDLAAFCFAEEHYFPFTGTDPRRVARRSLTRLVLTDSTGVRRFGMVLCFVEPLQVSSLLDKHDMAAHFSEALRAEAKAKTWFAPRCICVLSRWPMFVTFEAFLLQTLRIARAQAPLPIECYISNFVNDTPVPPRGQMQVQTVLGDMAMYVKRPPKNELPLLDLSLLPLFNSLSVGNILLVFSCLLREQKVALCSSSEKLLTPVGEALRALLFPFEMQCIYIPLLPRGLSDFLYAPVPFFMGIDSSFLELCEVYGPTGQGADTEDDEDDDNRSVASSVVGDIEEKRSIRSAISLRGAARRAAQPWSPSSPREARERNKYCAVAIEPRDVVYVDLDRDAVLLPLQSDNRPLKVLRLPKPLERRLRESLKKLAASAPRGFDTLGRRENEGRDQGAPDFGTLASRAAREKHAKENERSAMREGPAPAHVAEHAEWTREVRTAFLDFGLRLMRNYKKYLVRQKGEVDWCFDKKAFLSDHGSTREFCGEMLNTLMFECFARDAIAALNGGTTERDAELRLFDEMVVSMENHSSKMGRLVGRQRKQQPTPILDSTVDRVAATVFVPLPLPPPNVQAEGTYSYASFPALDPALMRSDPKARQRLVKVSQASVKFFESELQQRH